MTPLIKDHALRGITSAVLLGALLLTASAPVIHASGVGAITCQVRNVTQGTTGGSFKRMVALAHEGDRLRVRGSCASADVVIRRDLTISGVDGDAMLHGSGQHRVLRIRSGATVTLRRLRLARGAASSGGAIQNRGDLTLVDSVVQRNFGTGGGGIANYGELHLRDSVVRRNGSWYAGGIWNGGRATLTRSRVTANRSVDQGTGGGIYNSATMTLVDSVVADNRVYGGAAGIDDKGVLTLLRSIVRFNRSGGWDLDDGGGAGIQNSGELVMVGSHVTDNVIRGGPGSGGGVFNRSGDGTVTPDGASSVTGNAPDDCVGTPAC